MKRCAILHITNFAISSCFDRTEHLIQQLEVEVKFISRYSINPSVFERSQVRFQFHGKDVVCESIIWRMWICVVGPKN